MADAATNTFLSGPAAVAIPARSNPMIYVRLFAAVVLVGVALRRGGLWWLLGIAGGLLGARAGFAVYHNQPTDTFGS